ncbi:hypothetical protein QVD99_003296 [Batrachochytrium dendrobatidis]|nr:hypothetical protein QVD99_003296 [Batrachochytrium dendrobatidis]
MGWRPTTTHGTRLLHLGQMGLLDPVHSSSNPRMMLAQTQQSLIHTILSRKLSRSMVSMFLQIISKDLINLTNSYTWFEYRFVILTCSSDSVKPIFINMYQHSLKQMSFGFVSWTRLHDTFVGNALIVPNNNG